MDTGTISCPDCGFIHDDTKKTHMMFTDPGVEVQIETSLSVSECEIRILAVGKTYEYIHFHFGS